MENIGFDGRAVANYILDVCYEYDVDDRDENDYKITNLALQKIVYFCHVLCLVDLKICLVKHEFEAWDHGPVLPYLYQQLKEFGDSSIPPSFRADEINLYTGKREEVTYKFDPKTKKKLAETVKLLAPMGAFALLKISHMQGGPWHRARRGSDPVLKINNRDIFDFYSRNRLFF